MFGYGWEGERKRTRGQINEALEEVQLLTVNSWLGWKGINDST